MSVTLVDVLAAARARCAPLVGELAGYLVLGVADQVAAAPRRVAAADIILGPDGAVALVGGRAASDHAAEASLRDLLKHLLVNASSASPALSRASRGSCGRGVAALVRELEASLIPVNRAAGKRAATRLYRETKRAVDEGLLAAWRESERESQRVEMESDEPPEVVAEVSTDQAPPRKRDCAVSSGEATEAIPPPVPAAAERVDRSEEPALAELSDAPDVEVVVELSSPPPPEVAAALPAARHVRAADEPSHGPPAVEEEDVTRPEPIVLRAACGVGLESESCRDTGSKNRPSGEQSESDFALTPPLGSIASLQSSAAPDHGQRSLTGPVIALLDMERTDPMHQGEYLEISESLGNYALALGSEDEKLDAACRAVSSPPAPVAVDTGGPAPASEADEPRPAFVLESPPWAPNATTAVDGRAHPVGQWLREAKWAWPDLSPVPPAPELVAPPPVASAADSLPGGAHAVQVANVVVPSCGLAAAEDSFPPEDGWDVPAAEEAAVSLLREVRAPSTFSPRRSQVEDLVASFTVADQREDGDVCRDLKRMAGLDLTPLPGATAADD